MPVVQGLAYPTQRRKDPSAAADHQTMCALSRIQCTNFRVPIVRQPTRRSTRLAGRKLGKQKDRKHAMLGKSAKTATRHGVNGKGFEVRAQGAWA